MVGPKLPLMFNGVEQSLGSRGDRKLGVAVGRDSGGHLTLEKFLSISWEA